MKDLADLKIIEANNIFADFSQRNQQYWADHPLLYSEDPTAAFDEIDDNKKRNTKKRFSIVPEKTLDDDYIEQIKKRKRDEVE